LLYVVPQEEQDRWHCQSSARAKHANAPTPHIRKLGCNAIQELAKKIGAVAHMYEEGYLARENQISTPTRKKELLYLRKYILPGWGALSRPSRSGPLSIRGVHSEKIAQELGMGALKEYSIVGTPISC
jgi:hypothetical protein